MTGYLVERSQGSRAARGFVQIGTMSGIDYNLQRHGPDGGHHLQLVDVLKMAWWDGGATSWWFARVVRCSEADRRRISNQNLVVVLNGTCLPPIAEREAGQTCSLFVGTLGYEPNRAGLEWFLKQIWPLIRQAAPEAEVDVVGGKPSPWLLSRHGNDGILGAWLRRGSIDCYRCGFHGEFGLRRLLHLKSFQSSRPPLLVKLLDGAVRC